MDTLIIIQLKGCYALFSKIMLLNCCIQMWAVFVCNIYLEKNGKLTKFLKFQSDPFFLIMVLVIVINKMFFLIAVVCIFSMLSW